MVFKRLGMPNGHNLMCQQLNWIVECPDCCSKTILCFSVKTTVDGVNILNGRLSRTCGLVAGR